jgi:hypothetical protein
MALRLIQIVSSSGERQLVAATEDGAHLVNGVATTYELAKSAISAGVSLAIQVEKQGLGVRSTIRTPRTCM